MSKQDGSRRQITTGPVDDSASPIIHVDMDAFFASVELLHRPELRGKPVIVGGTGPRAVVAAASYEARKYGVNSAMPMNRALSQCPQAVVLPVNGPRYREYSRRVMAIFEQLTPLVEKLSVDEAFLDVSGARRLLGRPTDIGRVLRRRVYEETGLTCSVGIAATKFVAKVASGRAKPDGLLVIPTSETRNFLDPLPVSTLWGAGAITEATLRRLGLKTVGDVARAPLSFLQHSLGLSLGERLHQLACGVDFREVSPEREEKSIGHEVTFRYDVTDSGLIRRELLRLAGDIGVRLRRENLAARTVVLKLRYGDFRTVTRSRTLPETTDVAHRIYEEVAAAYQSLIGGDRPRVRLIGVRVTGLEEPRGQAVLWDPDESWRGVERTVDVVSQRFGRGVLTVARLVGEQQTVPRSQSS